MAQLLLWTLFLALLPASGSTYSLQDLEVLAAEGSVEEFFAHALDVRPSERMDGWKGMVSKMGDKYTRGILQGTEITPAQFKKVEELFLWPALEADEVFKLRRQEIGFAYLTKCLRREDPCWKELKTFWERNPHDPDTAIRLAELVKDRPDLPFDAWIFYDVALKSRLSEFYCKKDFVMSALWSKLELDYIRLGPEGNFLKKLDDTVHPQCLPSLNKTAYKLLRAPVKTADRELAFQILNAQSKIDPKLRDFFYTVYLLERPSRGELFNFSWNKVVELGKSQEKREKVLEELKNLDPLPDEIMASMDQPKRRAVLSHFKRHFPEYIDHYSEQCIKFYGGKESFPQGNPTIHCQDLMNSDLASQIVDEFKLKQFKDAKKI